MAHVTSRVFFAAALLAIAGCASTRHEPPPEVARQPPPITASEAVNEGQQAAQQADSEAAAAAKSSAVAPQRSRPTDRSTQEILDQNAAAPEPLDFVQRLDHAHDRLYTWEQGVVEATDRHFAAKDEPLKPVPAAPFRIGTTLETIDRADGPHLNFDANFDIALSLPNIEKRLRIFITSDALDSGARDNRRDSPLRAGLRYSLLRDLDFDVGVRVDIPPVAFSSVKWTHEYQLGSWNLYPLAELFAETRQSVGYAAGATFDHWSGRYLVRSSSYAKWRHDRDQTAWSQTFVYARAKELIVPNRYGSYLRADDIGRGWGVDLQISGDNADQVTRYETGVFVRNRTANRWLYWFVEPLVNWDRKWKWSPDPGIRIGLDALFWDLARPAK